MPTWQLLASPVSRVHALTQFPVCAALGDGAIPAPSNFYHLKVIIQRVYVSPVITYLPVSPVAPPNKITLDLDTYVIVWPNLARGTSPKVSTFSTLLLPDDILNILLFYLIYFFLYSINIIDKIFKNQSLKTILNRIRYTLNIVMKDTYNY